MDLNHLHLHVHQLSLAQRFYERYFDFEEIARHGEILFLRNNEGFDLTLIEEEDPDLFPEWFHFGFRLEGPEDVTEMYRRMRRGKITIVDELTEDEDYVNFRCADPDGNSIEVYWE
jgi:catechol-2,3-dioxygenase